MGWFTARSCRSARRIVWVIAALLWIAQAAGAQTLPHFDFTQVPDIQEWHPANDITRMVGSPEGMVIAISGDDPYLYGPKYDYPAGQTLWLNIRLKSDQTGIGQIFYFEREPTEANSVKFPVRGGQWVEAHVPLPPLGPGYYLRFDPPGSGGTVVVASMEFAPRNLLAEPDWPQPVTPAYQNPYSLLSGDLELTQDRAAFGGFALRVAGEPMAMGQTRPLIGYLQGGKTRWLNLAERAQVRTQGDSQHIEAQATCRDEDGADWEITQRFTPSRVPGAIDAEIQVRVSQDRDVFFLPLFVLLPGAGTFGVTKQQALFAGLEYLDHDEPSSSEADIIGPEAQRQVPASFRITFPLMALQAHDRYVGLSWDPAPNVCALFDSPDRHFKSGGHVMGVLFPGCDGSNRAEGSLLPYGGERLAAGKPLTLRVTLLGGKGQSVVPAVQQYVALRGLPPIPKTGLDFQGYVALAAASWLDSKIREGNLFRHAYPGRFTPQPAADAALLTEWLARQTTDPALAHRLTEAAQGAIAQVPPDAYNFAGVSHVRYPVPALIYGAVAENAERAQAEGRKLLSRFAPDGSVPYQPPANGADLGKTHFAPDADGLTASVIVSLLEMATVSGDPDLEQQGLRMLRALDKFAGTVPRGAQTWEVPLHTPDILASALLVRAYTLGYALSGDRHLLDQARYWAWTGVPFVYLINPTGQPVGPYATTPVYGATHWTAPNWMGLPVQWCGLVYADALSRLLPYDPSGPWKRLADGITASGIQQTWPLKSNPARVGLLPDSFNLNLQFRNDAAINPGTLLTNAVRFFDKPALYDFHASRANGLCVHAPGALTQIQERAGILTFTVHSWLDRPYHLLIVGFKEAPQVRINGQETPLTAPQQFLPQAGRLILQVEGTSRVEIRLPAASSLKPERRARVYTPMNFSPPCPLRCGGACAGKRRNCGGVKPDARLIPKTWG